MYKRQSRKQITGVIPSQPVHEYECDHSYHPLSYYLNGGSDPTGEHLALTRVTTSDTAEEIANGCGVDALCDPRTNLYEIYDQLGAQSAQNVVDAQNAGETGEVK